jgi:hypothetical protein
MLCAYMYLFASQLVFANCCCLQAPTKMPTAKPTARPTPAPLPCLKVGAVCSTARSRVFKPVAQCCGVLDCLPLGDPVAGDYACVDPAGASVAALTLTVAGHTGNSCTAAVQQATDGVIKSGLCGSGCAVTEGSVAACLLSAPTASGAAPATTPAAAAVRRLQAAGAGTAGAANCSATATDSCDVSVLLNLNYYTLAADKTAGQATAAGLNAFTTAGGYAVVSSALGVPVERMSVSPITVSSNPKQPIVSAGLATSAQAAVRTSNCFHYICICACLSSSSVHLCHTAAQGLHSTTSLIILVLAEHL